MTERGKVREALQGICECSFFNQLILCVCRSPFVFMYTHVSQLFLFLYMKGYASVSVCFCILRCVFICVCIPVSEHVCDSPGLLCYGLLNKLHAPLYIQRNDYRSNNNTENLWLV